MFEPSIANGIFLGLNVLWLTGAISFFASKPWTWGRGWGPGIITALWAIVQWATFGLVNVPWALTIGSTLGYVVAGGVGFIVMSPFLLFGFWVFLSNTYRETPSNDKD